ncbi:MAG: hypothetical protein ABJF25_28590, partial [Rhodopirellula bahusiensis]
AQFGDRAIGFHLAGLGRAGRFEGPFSLAHDGIDPVVDQRRLNLHLVGYLGNRHLVDKVLSDGGSLVSSRERASFSCHCEISSGENSSPLADFQFQERQHSRMSIDATVDT